MLIMDIILFRCGIEIVVAILIMGIVQMRLSAKIWNLSHS